MNRTRLLLVVLGSSLVAGGLSRERRSRAVPNAFAQHLLRHRAAERRPLRRRVHRFLGGQSPRTEGLGDARSRRRARVALTEQRRDAGPRSALRARVPRLWDPLPCRAANPQRGEGGQRRASPFGPRRKCRPVRAAPLLLPRSSSAATAGPAARRAGADRPKPKSEQPPGGDDRLKRDRIHRCSPQIRRRAPRAHYSFGRTADTSRVMPGISGSPTMSTSPTSVI